MLWISSFPYETRTRALAHLRASCSLTKEGGFGSSSLSLVNIGGFLFMGGHDMSVHVPKEVQQRIIARDKRRCQVCMLYFGEHRPLLVIQKDADNYSYDDSNLETVCYTCEPIVSDLRRKAAA